MAPEMSCLACDPSKLTGARMAAIETSRDKDKDKYETEKIGMGMGYDGRRDKYMRAMVADSSGILKKAWSNWGEPQNPLYFL